MSKIVKRTVVAGAAALVLFGGFSGVDVAVANANTMACQPVGAKSGSSCHTVVTPDHRCDGPNALCH